MSKVYVNCVIHRLTQLLKLVNGIVKTLKKRQFFQYVPNRRNRDKIYGANILNTATVERVIPVLNGIQVFLEYS